MKPHNVLFFLLTVYALVLLIWFSFPAKGIEIGGVNLKFPNYETYLADLQDSTVEVDVDAVLQAVQQSYEMQEQQDTLKFYYDYVRTNPNRIYLPDGDYTFLDPLMEAMEGADTSGRVVRILHLGDSQLEMDRISAVLRQRLQERFGGSGPGMVPMVQKIPTVSLTQRAGGNVTHFVRVGDSLSLRANHRRYGPLAQLVEVDGNGSFTFYRTKNRYSQEKVKHVTRVSALLGQNSEGLEMTLRCDDMPVQKAVVKEAGQDAAWVTWALPQDAASGTLTFEGDAEVYGIALDSLAGVTVDNVPLRGCSGTIFTGFDTKNMAACFDKTDTKLIIMQFGGNMMPSIYSKKAITPFVERIIDQIEYFKKVAPEARIMFIGPADMSKSEDGKLSTWPLLPELNDSLKVRCLQNGAAYWDMFNVMGGRGSMIKWVQHNPPLGGPDHVHFTHRGALEIGDALSKSFLLYDDFYRLRKEISEEKVREYFDLKDSQEEYTVTLPKKP